MEILTNFWFIQSIGIVALVFVIFAWNAEDRKNILNLQSINNALFIFHFLLLGAFTGALMSGVTLARNLVFVHKGEKKWASSPIWLYVFIFLSIIVLITSWQGWPSILPVIGVIIGTFAISREKPKEIRFLMVITSFAWIPYSIIVHSYSGLIAQIVSLSGLLLGMYRLDTKT